jgi:trk system potassium uptake protein TrkA
MKVAIGGAGNVGMFLAQGLGDAGHEILVIERNFALVERLRADHPSVAWHAGDACEVAALRAAGLDGADVLVAATGDDEDNLVMALLAKQEFAVPRVVARVNHPDNEWLFNETWGVDVSVSTPHLLAAVVQEAVSIGSLVRLLTLGAGQAGLVEVTLADQSPVTGVSLADVGFPRNATIVAVIRDANVVVPRGDTTLEPGDEVIVLVTAESEAEVRQLLVG